MAQQGKMIEMNSGDGATLGVYHVEAQGERKGGLVLVQEVFGVTDHIKELCDGYASRGYEVLAPSIYDRQEKLFQADYNDEGIQKAIKLATANTWENVQMDVQMCIDQLKDKGPVFAVGYCYGGSSCWVAACRCENLTAASGYYGSKIIDMVDERPKCPIILHFGEKDAGIPMDSVRTIESKHPNVPVYIYPAGHGFNSDRRSDYDEDCAKLALQRTLDLFESAAR